MCQSHRVLHHFSKIAREQSNRRFRSILTHDQLGQLEIRGAGRNNVGYFQAFNEKPEISCFDHENEHQWHPNSRQWSDGEL